MIVEHAEFTVSPDRAAEFEKAYGQAREFITQARGFRFAELLRGVERPDAFLLLVGWETVEDHTVGFRESDLYASWRALLHPFFAAPARVEHFEERADRLFPK
jgi:heme-degrading monooxygenase HmoA